MPRNFTTQLAGQIGESLVVAELGRRGIVATAFAGNVPDIDLLAYRDGRTIALQVKSVRAGSVSFDAKRYMNIVFDGDRQIITDTAPALDAALIFVIGQYRATIRRRPFFHPRTRRIAEPCPDQPCGMAGQARWHTPQKPAVHPYRRCAYTVGSIPRQLGADRRAPDVKLWAIPESTQVVRCPSQGAGDKTLVGMESGPEAIGIFSRGHFKGKK
ncbi:hypothetical protein BD293_2414 [Roseinatronobacter monicus]|uniref:PD(D/E)XK endonuclease domain-containing protein n=1 Tax=Roseinatronobacter monicus TaxID=393481 RepID=A0A543KFB0_9RHOB|nr:hypothetical protein BD293_2414 [Roseinatronobacter monicus]